MPNMEFGRRLAVERELEKTSAFGLSNACEWRGCVCMGWGGGGGVGCREGKVYFHLWIGRRAYYIMFPCIILSL